MPGERKRKGGTARRLPSTGVLRRFARRHDDLQNQSGTAAFEWSDSITVLQAQPGLRLAKRVLPDRTFQDYDRARHFTGSTVALDGMDDLRSLIELLLRRPDRCVVRGKLINGDTAHGIRRLVYPKPETNDRPTLMDVPRRWLALDAEGLERPASVRADDLLASADIVMQRLPRAFAEAEGIVQASAGHGIKPDIRLRLWFWLDRPVTGAEAKFWLSNCMIDKSVLNPGQPIYTAAPVFAGGCADHIALRLASWPGYGWVRVPPAEQLVPPPRPAPEFVQPAFVAGSARAVLYVKAALDNAHKRITNAALRHPAILSEACSLARFVNNGFLTKSELHETLWNAAQQADKDDEAEISRMVEFGLSHADGSPLPEGMSHG